MSILRSFRHASAFAVLFLAACASATAEPTNVAEVRVDPVCAARNVSLGEAIGRAPRDPSYDAAVVTRTYDCGSVFRAAGPSQLGEDRLFRIGSMTKSYIAVATLLLVDAGKVTLDAPLATYLPDVAPAIRMVTPRQLLQHTSGIFNYTNTEAFWKAFENTPFHGWTPDELVALALAQPLSTPGTWSYSNTNFVLLGQMLEAVEKATLAAILRDRVLAPNALDHTFLEGDEPLVPADALAPGFDVEGVDISRTYSTKWAWAAGAMAATASDAARFVELLGSGALLSPALQAELVNGVDIPGAPGLRYGLGVFLFGSELTGGAGQGIGHGGDIMGSHTWGIYFPERRSTVFGVVDSDRGNGNDVLVEVLTANLLPPAPGTPVTPPSGTPKRGSPRGPLAEL